MPDPLRIGKMVELPVLKKTPEHHRHSSLFNALICFVSRRVPGPALRAVAPKSDPSPDVRSGAISNKCTAATERAAEGATDVG